MFCADVLGFGEDVSRVTDEWDIFVLVLVYF